MIKLLEILIIYAGIITIKYFKLREKNKINYSNYVNCLRALKNFDPDLSKYLEKRGE